MRNSSLISMGIAVSLLSVCFAGNDENKLTGSATINAKDTGYRGIWYMNQPSHDEYVYKYSGGLGTYCAKHKPFAVYCNKVDKTYFCYGEQRKTAMLNFFIWFRIMITRQEWCRDRR